MYFGRQHGIAGLGAWEVQNGQPVIVPPGTPGAFSTREDALTSLKARTADPVETMLKAKGGAAPASPILRLQQALKSLGEVTGDATLKKLVVDGAIGPKTVGAVNRTISQKYIVTPYFPRPELTAAHVRQSAANLAPLVEESLVAHGGAVTAPVVAKKRSAPSMSLSPIPAGMPDQSPAVSSFLSGNTVWYIVGGFSALLALAVVSKAMRREPRRRVEAEA